MEDLAPNVIKCVPVKLRKTRSVYEALQNNIWVTDIRGTNGWHGLAEYQELWDTLNDWNLNTIDDVH